METRLTLRQDYLRLETLDALTQIMHLREELELTESLSLSPFPR